MPTYRLKRCLFSLGDTYEIKRGDGVQGTVMVAKQTFSRSMLDLGISELEKSRTVLLPGIDGSGFSRLVFCDRTGQDNLIIVRPKFASRRPGFDFERNGVNFATLTQKWTWTSNQCCSFGRNKFDLVFRDGSPSIQIKGTLMELVIQRDKQDIAYVSKAYFPRDNDEYGVEVLDLEVQGIGHEVDDDLIISLAIVVNTVLSSLSASGRRNYGAEKPRKCGRCFCC